MSHLLHGPAAWLVLAALQPLGLRAQDVTMPEPIPLGTTQGQRANRLLIRNATIVSGRGSPRSNRAMPPEGPIDILIENGRIIDMVLRDPVPHPKAILVVQRTVT